MILLLKHTTRISFLYIFSFYFSIFFFFNPTIATTYTTFGWQSLFNDYLFTTITVSFIVTIFYDGGCPEAQCFHLKLIEFSSNHSHLIQLLLSAIYELSFYLSIYSSLDDRITKQYVCVRIMSLSKRSIRNCVIAEASPRNWSESKIM